MEERIERMLTKRNLKKTEFLRKHPEAELMPLVITLPSALAVHAGHMGSMD